MKNNFISLICTLNIALLFLLCSCETPVVSWNSSTIEKTEDNFSLKVYVENSGSMNGYMCDGSELKDAVYGYISALDSHADTTSLFYINSKVISYKKNLQSFIRDLNPISFQQAGGSIAHSDISEMFTNILANMKKDDVSFFISDCILDVPNGDAMKFFHNKKIELRNAIVKGLRINENLAIEILRLESTFNGRYFYTHGSVNLNNVKRPYFIWIIGDKSKLATIKSKVPFSEIEHGYQNLFSWSTPSVVKFEICNKQGRVFNKLPLRNTESDGKYHFFIKTNLKNTLQDSAVPCNLKYYKKHNPFLTIESVSAISENETDYTHIMDISLSAKYKPSSESITFYAPVLPSWVEKFNDDKGLNIQSNMDKTTGIKYLIEGISDAYKNKNELFKIQFVINRN